MEDSDSQGWAWLWETQGCPHPLCLGTLDFFFFFFFFFLFWAAPVAYRNSRARGRNRDLAAGLHHSHCNAGSKHTRTKDAHERIYPATQNSSWQQVFEILTAENFSISEGPGWLLHLIIHWAVCSGSMYFLVRIMFIAWEIEYINGQWPEHNKTRTLQQPAQETNPLSAISSLGDVRLQSTSQTCRKSDHYFWQLVQEARQ